MAPHSSTLVWKIPWAEEPGRLQSMGSLRVGHDRATSLSLFTFMPWRRIIHDIYICLNLAIFVFEERHIMQLAIKILFFSYTMRLCDVAKGN